MSRHKLNMQCDTLILSCLTLTWVLKNSSKKIEKCKKYTIKIKNNTPTRSLINVTLNLTSTIRTQIMK